MAAFSGGYIKEIVDSCIGKDACSKAANAGNIGSITNGSCVGKGSCQYAAESFGNIGYINRGCGGADYACRSAANSKGSIGGISNACNNISACLRLADGSSGGQNNFGSYDSVGAVISCCNSVSSRCTGSVVQELGLPVTCVGISASPTSSPHHHPPTRLRQARDVCFLFL